MTLGRALRRPPDPRDPWLWVQVVATLLVAVLVGSLASRALGQRDGAPVTPWTVRTFERGVQAARTSTKPRVLFVGNSLTAFNDLPATVKRLSRVPIAVAQWTPGGWTFADAAGDPRLMRGLRTVDWDVVVLQEQSLVPTLGPAWTAPSTAAAQRLTAAARGSRAVPLLFETWARREGDPLNVPGDTYEAMQGRLLAGYRALAAATGAEVVEVGERWRRTLARRPRTMLWASDGNHPTPAGSLLAAKELAAAIEARLGP